MCGEIQQGEAIVAIPQHERPGWVSQTTLTRVLNEINADLALDGAVLRHIQAKEKSLREGQVKPQWCVCRQVDFECGEQCQWKVWP